MNKYFGAVVDHVVFAKDFAIPLLVPYVAFAGGIGFGRSEFKQAAFSLGCALLMQTMHALLQISTSRMVRDSVHEHMETFKVLDMGTHALQSVVNVTKRLETDNAALETKVKQLEEALAAAKASDPFTNPHRGN